MSVSESQRSVLVAADELAGEDLAARFPPHVQLAVEALMSAIASAYPDIVMETLNAAVMALESGPRGPDDPDVARVSARRRARRAQPVRSPRVQRSLTPRAQRGPRPPLPAAGHAARRANDR